MAKTPTLGQAAAAAATASPAEPRSLDATKHYAVTLTRVAEWKGRKLSPAHDVQLRGDVAEALGDAVSDAVEV